MAFSVVMPALEMAQETGKLLAWRKKEGDRVSKGEPLLEIETDKAVVEVEAPADGILAGIKASEGSDIPVGQTIAWIVAPGEALPATAENAPPSARAGSHAKTEPAHAPVVAASGSQSSTSTAKISPKARRLAKELGVDLANVRASGPGGEILASDIQAAATANAADATSDKIEKPTSFGSIMAERTTHSWTTVPHFFVTREIDATELRACRERLLGSNKDSSQVRISHTDLLVALVSRVLLKHPRLNASWGTEAIHLHRHVHMGVAIAVKDGVVAAVIHNAHEASLADIASQRHELAERGRAGKLRPADIANATFTISNLGMYKVDQFSAIITPPQAAILAVGGIADRVVAVEGKPVVRPMMTLTVSCDHRVADGARAAQFLNDLAEALQQPAKFLG
jgi:pyruvate dehydrogenase E2 component (dihydrolipoamide acetyltransferase)